MEAQLPSVPKEELPGAEEREQARLPAVPTHDPASTPSKGNGSIDNPRIFLTIILEKEKRREKQAMLAT